MDWSTFFLDLVERILLLELAVSILFHLHHSDFFVCMFTEDIDELGDAFGLCPQLLVILISEHRHHFLKALHIVVHVLAKAAKGDVFLIDVAFAEAKSLGHTQVEEHLWTHIESKGCQNSSNLSFSCVV